MKKIHGLYNMLVALAAVLLVTACYEDKGNYSYHDVNTVEITIPTMQVRMPKEEAVEVTVVPEVKQLMEQGDENLSFRWKKLKKDSKIDSDRMDDYEDFAEGKVCKVTIEAGEPDDVGLLLVVKDNKNGTEWYEQGRVSVVRPFNPCWFVLQEKDGRGMLGAVEGRPDNFYMYPDVFQSEQKTSFPLEGKPLAVSARKAYGNTFAAEMLQFFGFKADPAMTIVTDKGMALLTPSTIAPKYTTEQILFEPAKQGKPFDISQYKMGATGELINCNGKNYFSHMDGFCVPYSLQYEEKDIAVAAYGASESYSYFYDAANHRFLVRPALGNADLMGTSRSTGYIRSMGSEWKDRPVGLLSIESDAEPANLFDPNNIDPGLVMRDIVCGGEYGQFAYAIASEGNSNQLTVFKFSSREDDPFCAAQYSIALPPTVDLATAKFAASYAYNNDFVFMTSGNKLYRLDLERQKVIDIYTYEADANAQIACLKFQNSEDVEEKGRTLGLAVNSGDTGVIVELKLAVSGDVDRDEKSTYVYRDKDIKLGKIVDISYSYE